MTVSLPIAVTVDQRHQEATDEVNRWRGRCVEWFARIERAIGESLAIMAAHSPSNKVRVPHHFGERIKELRAAVSLDGAFANARLLHALDALEVRFDHRNAIVHSTSTVWVGRGGHWLWLGRFIPSGQTEERVTPFDQGMAQQFETELKRGGQSLCNQLSNIRKDLEQPAAG